MNFLCIQLQLYSITTVLSSFVRMSQTNLSCFCVFVLLDDDFMEKNSLYILPNISFYILQI